MWNSNLCVIAHNLLSSPSHLGAYFESCKGFIYCIRFSDSVWIAHTKFAHQLSHFTKLNSSETQGTCLPCWPRPISLELPSLVSVFELRCMRKEVFISNDLQWRRWQSLLCQSKQLVSLPFLSGGLNILLRFSLPASALSETSSSMSVKWTAELLVFIGKSHRRHHLRTSSSRCQQLPAINTKASSWRMEGEDEIQSLSIYTRDPLTILNWFSGGMMGGQFCFSHLIEIWVPSTSWQNSSRPRIQWW